LAAGGDGRNPQSHGLCLPAMLPLVILYEPDALQDDQDDPAGALCHKRGWLSENTQNWFIIIIIIKI